MRKFIVIMIAVALMGAANLVWAQERPATNQIHKVTMTDVGKPGSGLSVYTNQAVIDKIVAGKKSVGRHLGASTMDTSTTTMSTVVIIKNAGDRGLSLVGTLSEGMVVVNIINLPSGRRMVLPALHVENEGDYWFDLWNGEIPFFFGIEGLPMMEVRIFDPNTGDMTIVTSQLDFWNPPYDGIRDIHVLDGTMHIAGEFDEETRVWVNHNGWAPTTNTPKGLEVDVNSIPEWWLYSGNNLITVINGNGRCDTYSYRYRYNN